MVELRSEVEWFAKIMEKKLRENDHKGGWHRDGLGALLKRIEEELDEAKEALEDFTIAVSMEGENKDEAARKAIDELADIANFCMMAADRVKHLRHRRG